MHADLVLAQLGLLATERIDLFLLEASRVKLRGKAQLESGMQVTAHCADGRQKLGACVPATLLSRPASLC